MFRRIFEFKKISVVAILLLGLVFLFIFLFDKFRVRTVILITDKPKLYGLTVIEDNNLLLIDEKKTAYSLLQLNPAIKSFAISKEFPDKLYITVNNRLPIAKLKNIPGFNYIDSEGILLTESGDYPGLPVISVSDFSIYSDKKADWKVRKIVYFIEEVQKQSIKLSQIHVDNSSGFFSILLPEQTEVIIPFESDIYIQVSSLQVILQRFKIVGKNVAKVDFRFDKPLVTLPNGEKISSSF